MGASHVGPLRLMMSADTPPMAGRSAMRKGDTEASAAAAKGRTSHNQVSVLCAARFSLLSDSGRTFDCQITTAPQPPFLRICSAAHKASAELCGLNQRRLRSLRCHERHAIECGRYGG